MNALSKGQSKQFSTARSLDRELTETELANIIGGGVLRGLPYYAMMDITLARSLVTPSTATKLGT